MIKNALILDTETTGIDPTMHKAIEIGVVLYSVEHKTVLTQFSTLLPAPENPCERINRIPSVALRALDKEAEHHKCGLQLLKCLVAHCDVIVAHNAEFDQQFLPKTGKRWLCTMSDFVWPLAAKDGGSLVNLALDHGIGVASAHRALTDCQLIAALFDRMDDLQGMFEKAMRPKALFRADVSYDDRQLAKDAGFKWDGDSRQWTRRVAVEDAQSFPFRVTKLADCQ